MDKVTIILPCRNEEVCIERCLDSIVANDYPKEHLEVFVVDGMSDDRTRELVSKYTEKYAFIKLLDNPGRTQQIATNMAIKYAQGTFVIRLDAHCQYREDYISQCLHYLKTWQADCVGGRLITLPRHDTLIGRAIATAMSAVFGVGRSKFRVTELNDDQVPTWIDTVPFGCYRRGIFEKIGFYREDIPFSEDIEFHQRMKKNGFKTLFVPSLVSIYYARSDLLSFWKHSIRNGIWAILPTKFTGHLVVRPMHLVPLFFVGSLVLCSILSTISSLFTIFLFLILGLYFFVNFGYSVALAFRKRELSHLWALPLTFSLLHFGYGLGSLVGVIKVIGSWKRTKKDI